MIHRRGLAVLAILLAAAALWLLHVLAIRPKQTIRAQPRPVELLPELLSELISELISELLPELLPELSAKSLRAFSRRSPKPATTP